MASDGSFHFESERGKLHFGRHEGTFYFYRVEGDDKWLQLLLLAMPRLPLAYREGLTWDDYVPVGLATHGLTRALVHVASSFYPALGRLAASQSFAGKNRIQTTIESRLLHLRETAEVELDATKGFASIKVRDIELRRITDAVPAEHARSDTAETGAASERHD
jgi:hypothetical protein